MGGQHAQAGHHTDLETQEGDQLRQAHDLGAGPAGIEQCLQIGRLRIARMQHQQVRMLERGGKPLPE